MARRYFCNISECIKLMLPPGEKTTNLEKRIKEKTANFVYLKKDEDEIELDIEIGKLKNEKQIKVVRFLENNDGIYKADLETLMEVSSTVLKTLEKNGYIEIIEQKIERNPFKDREIKRDKPLPLTEEQKQALNKIDNSKFNEFLLYGVTGSGKTEVYLQLIQNALNKKKKAIVLVPEISLTPQWWIGLQVDLEIAYVYYTVNYQQVKEMTNGKISKTGKCKIVIGARSAIFAPIDNLGIIIIDEEHDTSYKSDMAPRFNAKDIAKYLAKSMIFH